MAARAAESHKHRGVDRENERKRRFLRKQREEEDFWDEYEESLSESSSDESNLEDLSLDEPSSEEDSLEVDNKRGDNTHEGLGDHVQLGVKESSFRPIWKDDAGSYLRGIKGCGSSATENREKRRKRELEKSASQTGSIVEMFSTQRSKNQSHNENPLLEATPAPSPSKIPRGGKLEKVETVLELQTQAARFG